MTFLSELPSCSVSTYQVAPSQKGLRYRFGVPPLGSRLKAELRTSLVSPAAAATTGTRRSAETRGRRLIRVWLRSARKRLAGNDHLAFNQFTLDNLGRCAVS